MLGFAHTAIVYVVPYLLVLTLIVTIHELGHFSVARLLGVAVDRFAIGFGKAILSWRDRSGIQWQIGWIPFGGYVRFAGDENAASIPDQEDLEEMRAEIIALEGPGAEKKYFHFKPLWVRALVVAAGPAANFLLATVLFAGLLMLVGVVVRPARVDAVLAGSAAQRAGFQPGDMILKADHRPIGGFEDMQRYVMLRGGVPIDFDVERAGKLVHLTATPTQSMTNDPIVGHQQIGVLGVGGVSKPGDVRRIRYNPIQALGGGALRTWQVLDTTVYYIGRLVRGQVSADQLGGPLKIAHLSGAVAQAGAEGATNLWEQLIGSAVALAGLAAVVSVSIGFMNLLPIPVLDGGHLLFYAYESVARKPLGARVQAAGYRVGLALLVGLMLFATWNDLQGLRVFHFLGGLFS